MERDFCFLTRFFPSFYVAFIIGTIGNKNARSDAFVAQGLARASVLGLLANVRVNLESLSDAALGADLGAQAGAVASELERF